MNNSELSPTEPTEMLPKLNVRVDCRNQEALGDSPSALPTKMRNWLNETAGASANNASSPSFRLYSKLLVSNAAAGSIIGKAGGNINEFQAKTFSRIQLSKSGEYYPGTTERTLLVSGGLKQIIAALGLVFAKLQREGVAPVTPRTKTAIEGHDSPNFDPDSSVTPSHPVHLAIKLLVPQPLCGIIIGKMGTTVKAYAADTQTQIRVTAPDGPAAGLNHRIVTINGTTDNCLKAIALLTLKQTEDPKFQMYSELPSSYSSVPSGNSGGIAIPGGAFNGSPYVLTPQSVHAMQHIGYQPYIAAGNGNTATGGGMSSAGTSPRTSAIYATAVPTGGNGHQTMYANGMDSLATMTFPLPDDQATLVVGQGRGSGGIEDVQAAAGVRIKVELGGGKGISATHHQPNIAHITITGSPENVQYANFLMAQRLSSLMMMMHQQQQYAMIANHGNGTTYYHHHSYGRPQQHHSYGSNSNTEHGHHYNGSGGGGTNYENENGGRRPSPRTVMAAHVRGSNNGSVAGER
ncbi:hypothetical protein Ndes2526B_g02637 [Nannochloris sp. 'desiccata']